jgi:N-6 DNA Methylase
LALRPSHPKGAPPLVRSRSHASSESALPRSRCRTFHIDLIIVPRSGSATHPEPRPLFGDGQDPAQFDRVVRDPPLGAFMDADKRPPALSIPGSDARRSDSLFAAVVSRILGPRGRAAVVLPRSLLQRKGPEAQLDAEWIQCGLVEGVVSLPQGVRPWAKRRASTTVGVSHALGDDRRLGRASARH